jgi:hypothetical protein
MRMTSTAEFDEVLRRGREMRHLDKLIAQFEISDPHVPGKLKTPAAVVEYLKTRPEIERFKTAAIRDPAETEALAGNNNLELCHDSKQEVTKGNGEGNVAIIQEGESRRSIGEGAKPEFQGCPRCGRYLSAGESAIFANGVLFSHEKCARPHAPIYR